MDTELREQHKALIRKTIIGIRNGEAPSEIATISSSPFFFQILVEFATEGDFSSSEKQIVFSLLKALDPSQAQNEVISHFLMLLTTGSSEAEVKLQLAELLGIQLAKVPSSQTLNSLKSILANFEVQKDFILGQMAAIDAHVSTLLSSDKKDFIASKISSVDLENLVEQVSRASQDLFSNEKSKDNEKIVTFFWKKFAKNAAKFLSQHSFPQMNELFLSVINTTDCPASCLRYKAKINVLFIEYSSDISEQKLHQKHLICLKFREQQTAILMQPNLVPAKSFLRLLSAMIENEFGRETLVLNGLYQTLYFKLVHPHLSLDQSEVSCIQDANWEELMNYASDCCQSQLSHTDKTFAYKCLDSLSFNLSSFLHEITKVACFCLSRLVDPQVNISAIDPRYMDFNSEMKAAETYLLVLASLASLIEKNESSLEFLDGFLQKYAISFLKKFADTPIVIARFCTLFMFVSKFVLLNSPEVYSEIVMTLMNRMSNDSEFSYVAFALNLISDENRIVKLLSVKERMQVLFSIVLKSINPQVISLFKKVLDQTDADWNTLVIHMLQKLEAQLASSHEVSVIANLIDILMICDGKISDLSAETAAAIDQSLTSCLNALVSHKSDYTPEFLCFCAGMSPLLQENVNFLSVLISNFAKVLKICEGQFSSILKLIFANKSKLLSDLYTDQVTTVLTGLCFGKEKVGDQYSLFLLLKLLSSNNIPYEHALTEIKKAFEGNCDDLIKLILCFDFILDYQNSTFEERAAWLTKSGISAEVFLQTYMCLLLFSDFHNIHVFRNLNVWMIWLLNTKPELLEKVLMLLTYDFKKLSVKDSEQASELKMTLLESSNEKAAQKIANSLKHQITNDNYDDDDEEDGSKKQKNPDMIKFLKNLETYVFQMDIGANDFTMFRKIVADKISQENGHSPSLVKDVKFISRVFYCYLDERKTWTLRRFSELKKK